MRIGVAVSALAVLAASMGVQARDYISIVGSSTVYPFSTVVAEQFGRTSSFKTPKVESTGSGGGLKLFCAGVGVEHPDITNASRRIKQSEIDRCAKNGVTGIIEIKVGYDGIVIANAKSLIACPYLVRTSLWRWLTYLLPMVRKNSFPMPLKRGPM